MKIWGPFYKHHTQGNDNNLDLCVQSKLGPIAEFTASKYESLSAKLYQRFITCVIRWKHSGTLVCHLLQNLKVLGSNLDKDLKFIELEMMRDL